MLEPSIKNALCRVNFTLDIPESKVAEILADCDGGYEYQMETIDQWVIDNFSVALDFMAGDPEVESDA